MYWLLNLTRLLLSLSRLSCLLLSLSRLLLSLCLSPKSRLSQHLKTINDWV